MFSLLLAIAVVFHLIFVVLLNLTKLQENIKTVF